MATWNQIKQLFVLHKSERRGFLIFFSLIFLGISVLTWLRFFPPKLQYDEVRLNALADSLMAMKRADRNKVIPPGVIDTSLGKINPDTASVATFMRLGLTRRAATGIVHYREKAGHFTRKSFAHLYEISDSTMNLIAPHLVFKQENNEKKWKNKKDTSRAKSSVYWYDAFRLNLNTADSADLRKLRGIGAYYAHKIVYYRGQLGGYYSVGQLLDLWNFREGMLDTLMPHIYTDPSLIKKININRCTTDELASHPYINFRAANKVVTFRIHNGRFRNIHQLVSDSLLPDSVFSRLKPYLKTHGN